LLKGRITHATTNLTKDYITHSRLSIAFAQTVAIAMRPFTKLLWTDLACAWASATDTLEWDTRPFIKLQSGRWCGLLSN